ncbi:ankyrin repeat-containing domain protein [Baffinella frigidus]|nr:ankyrin repeat-containing domain protein [Cryptophyta sp. CCMP2293]|mmetsp:Transcript_67130/g.159209  ORF Transcript_67130/g.159209 Transcript_67130/m.159209 type:complete len:222 (-) Transcript_67130:257-922(-)
MTDRNIEWEQRGVGRESDKGSFDALIRRVNRDDADRMLLLHAAAAFGHAPGVHVLLEMGADVAQKDSDGSSPLHVASSSGEVEVMQLLLRAGASVDALNNHGETSLHLACTRQSTLRVWNRRYETGITVPRTPTQVEIEVVRTLLDAHAGERALNTAGWTPTDIAKANPNRAVLALLKKQTEHTANLKFLPFAMSQLPRLGQDSHVPDLDDLAMLMIFRAL